MATLTPTNLAAALGAILLAVIIYSNSHKRKRYPPGPPRWPVIGNLLDLPTHHFWEGYHEWAVKYKSDVIHIDAMGTHIVILDTREAATDLLEKRSSNYSSRGRAPMLNELVGWEWAFAFGPYTEEWRVKRKLFQTGFDAKLARSFYPQQTKACHDLLRRFLDSPEDYKSHLRHEAGSLIMDVTYGIDVLAENDPYITTAEKGMVSVAAATAPGAFMVDALPILKHVPAWFPGAGFQKKAAYWKSNVDRMRDAPFAATREAVVAGHARPSFVANAIQNMDTHGDIAYQQRIIRETAGIAYAGGSDTSVATMTGFMLAMVKFPSVQAKAQEELDRVLGKYQLPTFSDEDSLPYITAITLEFMRWHTAGPVAVPHMATEEDEYKGHTIPAGAIIIPNVWAMLHDENTYSDPFEFKPERFIKDGKIDKSVPGPDPVFGFGRRVCPGESLARKSMWLTVGSVLATFNIGKPLDANGKTIEVPGDVDSGMICHPVPFKCTITPRSKEAEKIIRDTATQGA